LTTICLQTTSISQFFQVKNEKKPLKHISADSNLPLPEQELQFGNTLSIAANDCL
jgi:hypothetical protein